MVRFAALQQHVLPRGSPQRDAEAAKEQTGAQGIPGIPGQPGGVTQAAVDAALALKAQNPSVVHTLPFGASANYDQVLQQEILDKMNELINALK